MNTFQDEYGKRPCGDGIRTTGIKMCRLKCTPRAFRPLCFIAPKMFKARQLIREVEHGSLEKCNGSTLKLFVGGNFPSHCPLDHPPGS